MIRRPPRSTQSRSSAASDVYKRQGCGRVPASGHPPAGRLDLRRLQVAGHAGGRGRGDTRPDRHGPVRGPDAARQVRCETLLSLAAGSHTLLEARPCLAPCASWVSISAWSRTTSQPHPNGPTTTTTVSYTHLRAHETRHD